MALTTQAYKNDNITIRVEGPTTRSAALGHHSKHKIATVVVAFGALLFLLRFQGKTLRNDWTPVGIGVKFLLVLCVGALLYYPYELFLKGPDAVQKAMRLY